MSGKIVQIIGAVVDVEFPRDELPKVYDALIVEGKHLVLEVQQQLGDGVARAAQPGEATSFNVIGRALSGKTTVEAGTVEAIVTIK